MYRLVSGQSAMAAQRLPTYATDKWVSLCATLAPLLEAWLLPAGFSTHLVLESFMFVHPSTFKLLKFSSITLR